MRVRRRSVARAVLGLGFPLAVAAAAASCNSTPSGAGLSATCSLNSDCNSPYVCVFARCHEQCTKAEDCAAGERCVSSEADAGAAHVCQLAVEATCNATTSTCSVSGQVCTASDQQCR